MTRILFILFTIPLLFPVLLIAQVNTLTGKVIDAESRQSLAFVHITYNKRTEGTTTDIDGNFNIQAKDDIRSLHLSYVGYEPRDIDVGAFFLANPNANAGSLSLLLQPSTFLLKELIFKAGENPAIPIIRSVVANKDRNNPEKIKSFSYKSYNKFIVDADIDEEDLKQKDEEEDVRTFLEKRYLFLMESVTERKYKFPDRSKEVVLANRVSGFKNPMFTTLANSFQPFTFYNEYISILGKNYLNPVSKNSERKYFFWLEDSIYSGSHKVYIISFKI